MKKLYFLISSFFLLGNNTFAINIQNFKIDTNEYNEKYQVELISGKKEKTRAFQGRKTHIFTGSLDLVLEGIENFEEKCNNELKKHRKWKDSNYECPHFNKSLSDSKIVQIENKKQLQENQIKQYLVLRNIYNRQEFKHVDLVEVFRNKNEAIVKQTMLSDEDVTKYIDFDYKKKSVFNITYGEFRLKQIEKNKIELDYKYYLDTNHWLLNKSISVSEIFDSIAMGLDELFKSIDDHLTSKTK